MPIKGFCFLLTLSFPPLSILIVYQKEPVIKMMIIIITIIIIIMIMIMIIFITGSFSKQSEWTEMENERVTRKTESLYWQLATNKINTTIKIQCPVFTNKKIK